MPDNRINTVLTAQDNASATINKLRTNVTQLGSKTSGPLGGLTSGTLAAGAAGIAASAAFGALTDGLKGVGSFMGQAARAAIDDEKSVAALTQTLKANVPAWDGSLGKIEEFTDASLKLGYSDDDTRASIQKLVVATGNVGRAMELSGLAMDIARGRNIDLASATQIVIKANMGNVGALRKLGIEVDKNADSTEILNSLQAKYAGQAQTYAQTTEGSMESAAQSINELNEDFGYALLPTIKDTMGYVNSTVIPGFEDLADTIDRIFHPENHTGTPLKTSVDKLSGLATDTAEALGKSPNPFEQWLHPQTSGTTLLDKVRPIGVNAADAFAEAWRSEMAANKEIFDNSARGIGNNLADALRGSKDQVKQAMDDVMWAIKHPMAQTRELARIEGAITTLEYKRGLASNTDEVNDVIDQQLANLRALWTDIAGVAYNQGARAGNAWAAGYQSHTDTGNHYKGSFFGINLNPGGKRKKRAVGGPVSAGETYLVGERGPELLHMGRNSGSISPNSALGGGPIHVVTVNELARLLDQNNGRQLALSPSSAYSR